MQRLFEYDYIRVIAIIAIIISHYLMYSGICSGIGRFLAGGGNILFFLISAQLYGMKWKSNDNKPFVVIQFLTRRFVKLVSALWPFLFILTFLFVVFNIDFSLLDLSANLVLLGYLFKLPGNGHLWFLTVLMVCYVMFALLSYLKLGIKLSFIMLVGGFVILILMELCDIPGNTFAIMGLCIFAFCNPMVINDFRKPLLIVVSIILNLFSIILFYNGLFDTNRIVAFILADFCGLSWLILLQRSVPRIESCAITWLSGICYEMYLVHHTLCAGPFVKVSYLSDSVIIQITVLFVSTLILATVLHYISKWFILLLKK